MISKSLSMRKTKLTTAKTTASSALSRWKILAQKRAAKEAIRIQAEAGARARTEWEAMRIQAIAVAKAKAAAETARATAIRTKQTAFMQENALVVKIGSVIKQFKTIKERDSWMAKFKLSSSTSRVREERLISENMSWKIQKEIVEKYIQKTKVQQERTKNICLRRENESNKFGYFTGKVKGTTKRVQVLEKVELQARFNYEALEKVA